MIEVQFLIPVSIVSKLAFVPVSCIFKFWFSHEMSLFSDFNNLIIVVLCLDNLHAVMCLAENSVGPKATRWWHLLDNDLIKCRITDYFFAY